MKLEKGKISNSQLIFLTIGFTLGSSVILSPGLAAKQDAWLAVLGGLGEALVFAFIFTTLAQRFPGQNPIQFNDQIYGRYLGKVVSVFYLWYFLHLGSMVLRNFGDFFSILMPQTPIPVFISLTALVCAYAARNGIEVIARCCLILIFPAVLIILFSTLLLYKNMKFSNLLPITGISLLDFLKAAHSAATFPFGETVVLLMAIASVNKIKQARGSIILALSFAGVILSIAAVRNTAVLGITEAIYSYPTFQAIRLIDIGEILTRLDILVAINVLTLGFVKISTAYYAAALGTAQLFNLRSYLPLIIPVGIIMVLLSIFQFSNIMENLFFANNIYPYYSLPFEVGLPLLSLLVAIIRGIPKSKTNKP